MFTFTEAQILAWVTPILWPMLRVLALLSVLPVIGQRLVPPRFRVALAFFVAWCAQGLGPPIAPVPLDSGDAVLMVAQQLVIGVSIGFAVRIVFAAVEFAGEVAGLQMGLNFAGFFDPLLASQATATQRLFGTVVAFLFVTIDGHLLVISAVVQSLQSFPVAPEPLGLLRSMRPHVWGAEIFRIGLWIAMPLIAIMMFINLVLGIASRVAPQMNLFGIGFPITLGAGLLSLVTMLPLLREPFVVALETMTTMFTR